MRYLSLDPWTLRAFVGCTAACLLGFVLVAVAGLPLDDAFVACFALFALVHLYLHKWPLLSGTWQQRGMRVMVLMSLYQLYEGARHFLL